MSKLNERSTAPSGKFQSGGRSRMRPRSEREAEVNRLVLILAAILGGVIVLILAVALLIDNVINPSQSVALVNGQNITVRDFQNRVKLERWQRGTILAGYIQRYGMAIFQDQFVGQQFYQEYQTVANTSTLSSSVLDQLVEAKLIEQYAAANNITVSEEEINKQVYTIFGFEPTITTSTPTTTPTLTLTPLVSPTPTNTPTTTPTSTPQPTGQPTNTPAPTITMTPTAFPTGIPTGTPDLATRQAVFNKDSGDYYASAAKMIGMSEADVRQIFREQALREKVMEAIVGKVPTEQQQYNVRHILVKTKEQADQVMKALQSGALFSDLARSVSVDTGSALKGGELGWMGDTGLFKSFADAMVNAEVGKIIGPIDSTADDPQRGGFHIMQIMAKEVRPVSNSEGQQIQATKFNEWLQQQKKDHSQTYSNWIEFIPEDPTLRALGLPQPNEVQPPQQSGFPSF